MYQVGGLGRRQAGGSGLGVAGVLALAGDVLAVARAADVHSDGAHDQAVEGWPARRTCRGGQ